MAVVVMVDIAEVVVGVDMVVDVMVAGDMEVEDIKPSIPSTAFHSFEAYYCTALFKITNPHLITILERVIKLSCPSLY